MDAAVEVRDLQRVYRSPVGALGRRVHEVRALDGVTFSVGRGELFGLLGCNGAGKTILTRILATILLPTGGTARVLGFDVATQARQVRPHIGVIFGGERGLYWRLSGRGNMRARPSSSPRTTCTRPTNSATAWHCCPGPHPHVRHPLVAEVRCARARGVVVQAYLGQARDRAVDPWFLFPLLVQPVIFASMAAVLFQRTGAQRFLLFGVIGSGLIGLWNTNIWSSGWIVEAERWQGTLELLLATPARWEDVLIGKSLANASLSVAAMGVTFAAPTWSAEGLRWAAASPAGWPVADHGALVALTLAYYLVARPLYRTVEHKVRVEGTLGHH